MLDFFTLLYEDKTNYFAIQFESQATTDTENWNWKTNLFKDMTLFSIFLPIIFVITLLLYIQIETNRMPYYMYKVSVGDKCTSSSDCVEITHSTCSAGGRCVCDLGYYKSSDLMDCLPGILTAQYNILCNK